MARKPDGVISGPSSHRGRQVSIALAAVLAIAGALTWLLLRPGEADVKKSADDAVLAEVLEKFSEEIPAPTGSGAEAVANGRKLLLLDNRLAYLQADLAFKTALLLDPTNLEGYAGWVQNRALLDAHQPDVSMRKYALDLIEYALSRYPDQPMLYRAKAYLCFSLGRMEEARELAGKALEKMKEDSESQLILGASYLESDAEMAIKLIAGALEKNPELNLANRLLGEANIRNGRFHSAMKLFDKRFQENPGQLEVLSAMARIYQEVGQFAKAKEYYLKVLAVEPNHTEALVALARLETQVFKRPRGAISVLVGPLSQVDKLPSLSRAQLLMELSVAYRILGKAAEAEEAVGRALQEDPISIPARYARAVLEQESDRLDPALSHLKELQTHLPQSARLQARIADLETMIPNYQQALQDFKRAVELDPDDLDILLMLATFHCFLDSPSQANAWLQRAMTVDPFLDEAHRKPTVYYDGPSFLRSTLQRALQEAEKYEEEPLVQSLSGIVLYRAGEVGRSRKQLLKALELDPECFPANLYLGVLDLALNQPVTALDFLKQAHRTDALQHTAANLLGGALLRKGKTDQAESLFESVLRTAPENLGARLGLAEILVRKKQKLKAAGALLQVYQTDRDHLRAKRLLFELGH